MKCRKLKIFEHFRKKQSFFQKKRKKGQVEILGLMIIMVLISLCVLFAVKYVFLSPKEEIKQEYMQKNIAQNMLDVMLDTDVEYNNNNISIKNLLIDCKKWNDGCDFVKDKINGIFRETLDKWGNKYYFEAKPITIGNQCLKGKKTGIQPFPELTIKLEICD